MLKGKEMERGCDGEGGCWRERGVVSSGDACCHSWAVVLSPCLLSSCIGVTHCCCVLSLPGCPSLLSSLHVSMCGCCMLSLACLHMWSSACRCMSWSHCRAMFMVLGHSSWCWVVVCGCQVIICEGRHLWVLFVGGDL